jgi:hypothetical protein
MIYPCGILALSMLLHGFVLGLNLLFWDMIYERNFFGMIFMYQPIFGMIFNKVGIRSFFGHES